MSFIGLGSVSDYCCHHMPCPTLVVRGDDAVLGRGLMAADEAHPPQTAQPKRVMVRAGEEGAGGGRGEVTGDDGAGPGMQGMRRRGLAGGGWRPGRAGRQVP